MEVIGYCIGNRDKAATGTATEAVDLIIVGTWYQEQDPAAVGRDGNRSGLRTVEINKDGTITVVYDIYPGLGCRR